MGGSVCAGLALVCFVVFLIWLGRSVVPWGQCKDITVHWCCKESLRKKNYVVLLLFIFFFLLSVPLLLVGFSHAQLLKLCESGMEGPPNHSVEKFHQKGRLVHFWFLLWYDFKGIWCLIFIFLVHFLSSPSLCLWTHFVVTVIPVLNLKLPVLSSFQFHSVNDGHFVVSGGLYLYISVPPFFDFLSVQHDYFFSAYLLKFV